MVKKRTVEEINELIREVLKKNKKYSDAQIEFSDYCRRKMEDRKIEEELVVYTLMTIFWRDYADIRLQV